MCLASSLTRAAASALTERPGKAAKLASGPVDEFPSQSAKQYAHARKADGRRNSMSISATSVKRNNIASQAPL
jgi:hypothetical protein